MYQQIKEYIKEQIRSGELRLGDLVSSEIELMEKFHVSQITTKNALNGLAEEGIVERVRGKGTFVIDSELLKGSNQSTTNPVKHSNGIVGLILPSMKTKIEQEFVNYIEMYASKYKYNLMIKITRESQFEESNAIEMFHELGAKGVIIFPTEKETYNESILRLTLDKFPLVLIDRYLENIRTYSVSSENEKGTFSAISYLIHKGHQHIGLISPLITNTVTIERSTGFEQAFLNNGLVLNKNMWLLINFHKISKEQTPMLIQEFFLDNPDMTAVFIMNAELSRYTNMALENLKKEYGRDIELISFDDSGIEGLAYIQQDIEQCSKQTMELLQEQLEGTYNPRRVFIPVYFKKEEEIASKIPNI
ncbi:GntR family transcriptional regulator [Lederbergia sp. NSJ-179]|uniref:GntR family transcriptional regulator n=1 Tax=Lederbergia sp. NSJ-179 TaxID=2931402 RepID=UPI001FD3093E|nr:GntR family transcriptional regulator [Lederbergia sp. NSJ-179]MCJ7842884.1 GntR family transcriptional regulator [Lederbergia sp. NSJ-179]